MTFKNRQEKMQLFKVLLTIITIIILILAVGFFGLICQHTVKAVADKKVELKYDGKEIRL